MYIMYTYIYTLYGIQDPGPLIDVTVYTDPYPVPHEATNIVYWQPRPDQPIYH